MPKFHEHNVEKVRDEIQFKYKDIFDLREFYDNFRHWLMEYGWRDIEDHDEHFESYYGEKIDQSGVKEIWIRWRVAKQPEQAPYIHYFLDFNWHVIGLTNTEIVREGHKLKVNKGEVEIKINCYLQKKYKEELEKHFIMKHFKDIFEKRIYKKSADQRKKELYQELYEMQAWVKQWFKLKRYLPYEETKSYFPSAAYPSHIKSEEGEH